MLWTNFKIHSNNRNTGYLTPRSTNRLKFSSKIPKIMQKVINRILKSVIKFCPKSGRPVKVINKLFLPVFGVLSIIWIILRVLPKPDRVTYPCMKVAIPFASSLIIYFGSLLSSIVILKNAFRNLRKGNILAFSTLVVIGLFFTLSFMVQNKETAFGSTQQQYDYIDPLGPNTPIGEAKGIIPGRVVWMHNPDATNEDCVPYEFFDGYFLDKNADQELIDQMLSEAVLSVTGEITEEEAWRSIFQYFNINHEKGEVGYTAGEKIFIKINAVHAWTTNADLSIKLDSEYGKVDTSPQVILAVLRQLINKGGVPQDAIYIGDPYTNIFKHLYNKLSAEFPDVHYMSRGDYPNREKLQYTNSELIKFSDRGTVLDKETDSYYDCVINADYVLSLPALKGHRGGGVTFFAKNHFGTNTQSSASHMHKGLHKGTSAPLRGDYNQYRVFVDLMSYEHLGGKTLIYIGDFLWGTSMEHDPPVKFQSAPFNDDWTSSILVSLDPVAIASVGLDIYQEEFKTEDLDVYPQRHTYVRFSAVDDYLHQAASKDWWPEGIVYDPEGDGTPISSLGVHEHWNNANDKQYSKNLGTGDGIELVYQNLKSQATGISASDKVMNPKLFVSEMNTVLQIEYANEIPGQLDFKIYNMSGQLVKYGKLDHFGTKSTNSVYIGDMIAGGYIITLKSKAENHSLRFLKNQ